MSFALAALLPVFITILLGAGLRTAGFVRDDQWSAIDHICYYVLFPAIIVKEIAGADFAGLPVARMALALMLGVTIMSVALLVLRRPLSSLLALNGPQYSSLFQGSTRWHTFIALAIVPPLFGAEALALAAVAAAAMTPLLNIINVGVLGVYAAGKPPELKLLLLAIAKNPFVVSCVVGILLQTAGIELPKTIFAVLDIVGKGALGLALLAAGAGLRFDQLRSTGATTALATVLKLAVMPLLVFALTQWLGVSGTPQHVAVICAAVPTGSGAYVLARQMGGDAPLVASILTLQVIAAALTLPSITMLLEVPSPPVRVGWGEEVNPSSGSMLSTSSPPSPATRGDGIPLGFPTGLPAPSLQRLRKLSIEQPLMNARPKSILKGQHLLGIEGLTPEEINALLDLADGYVELSRQIEKKQSTLRGRTQINLFFEASTRTQSSFELAGKRLGADVMNMAVKTSALSKGETVLDTAITLNAMHPDLLIVRHHASGAVELLAQKMGCAVVNAGDGQHEHPTQALLDALTIRRRKGKLEGLIVAICGDILHSRVARSNIQLLHKVGARVRLIAPSTLLPSAVERLGCEVYRDMREGLKGADIIMMLRLQLERMSGAFVPSIREYYRFFGLDQEKLELATGDALVMHPGPMNRGVEIDSAVADGIQSVIREQVEMGVAVRMAVLDALARNLPGGGNG
jgi:aspartate carbamoyltransferase catalytic subunit